MEYLIQDSTLTGIANAIREKTGKTDALLPSQMASEIGTITVGGGSGEDNLPKLLYKTLEHVDIPNGVEEIPDYLFSGQSSLKSFSLPKNLKIFGKYSFWNSALAGELIVPESESVQFRSSCFANCRFSKIDLSNLTSAHIYAAFSQYPEFVPPKEYLGINNAHNILITENKGYIPPNLEMSMGYLSNSGSAKEIYIPANFMCTYNNTPSFFSTVPSSGVSLFLEYDRWPVQWGTLPSRYTNFVTEYNNITSTTNPEYKYTIHDNKAYITKLNIESSAVPHTVPETIDGLVVAGVSYAFSESLFTEIYLPDSVESIPIGAFYGCINLEKISIPKMLHKYSRNCIHYFLIFGSKSYNNSTQIGTSYAKYFYDNSGDNPANNSYSFGAYYPNSLKEIIISADSVDNQTLKSIPSTIKITFGENLEGFGRRKSGYQILEYTASTEIDFYCKNAKNFLDTTYSNNRPFAHGYQHNLNIKNTVETLPDRLAYTYTNPIFDSDCILTEIPEKFSYNLSQYCSTDIKNTPVVLPESVLVINKEAFSGTFRGIQLPSSLKRIESRAFYTYNISNFTFVIPETVEYIGSEAFYHYTNPITLKMLSSTPPTLASTNALNSLITIEVPKGAGDAYKNASNWSTYSSKITEATE